MAGSVRAGRVGPTTTGAHAGSLHWRQEGDAASRLLHHPARSITGHPAALFKGKSSLRHSLTASINQPANCFSFSQIPEFIGFQLIVRTFKVIPEFRNSGIHSTWIKYESREKNRPLLRRPPIIDRILCGAENGICESMARPNQEAKKRNWSISWPLQMLDRPPTLCRPAQLVLSNPEEIRTSG